MMWRIATFATVGTIFGVVGLWIGDREAPTRITEAKVENSPVKRNGEFVVVFNAFRIKDCASRVERSMFDAQRVRYTYEDLHFENSPGPIGVPDEYRVRLRVPEGSARGEARFRSQALYYCNPLHRLWPIKGEVIIASFDIVGD
jgi:hypothetical protein